MLGLCEPPILSVGNDEIQDRVELLKDPPMANRKLRARLLASCAFALALSSAGSLRAQANPTSHKLTLGNVAETIDANGRRVFVANVGGDLPGVLTLALVVGPNGVVSGGEWALNVSYIKFGPPDGDGDGDPSESLVQRGVIKGSVSGGSAILDNGGLASDLNAIRLNISGATLEFASITAGTGSVLGSSMNQQAISNGFLTITF